MSLAVDNPIVNSPFEQPSKSWDYSEGQPILREGRRPAGYYLRPRTRSATGALFEEEFVPLDMVNEIRVRVKVGIPSGNQFQFNIVTPARRKH